VSVCLFVHTLKRKWLELSTPNLVHMYSIVATLHALTQRSKGQGYTVAKTVSVARVAWWLSGRALDLQQTLTTFIQLFILSYKLLRRYTRV